jgi:hypothetical protein
MKKVQPIVFIKIFIPIIAVIGAVLIGLCSCKSSASCDAYGQNNIEYGNISEAEAS